MLVLLSFVLVLGATVLLVLGLLVSDGLSLIYLSIGMSALAAVLLVVAVRMSKPVHASASGPAPLDPEHDAAQELVGAGTTTTARHRAVSPPSPVSPAPPATADPMPAAASFTTAADLAAADDDDDDWLSSGDDWGSEDEVEFPIADYDDLTVDEVLGLLPQLYSDELDVVEARERQGMSRTPVLQRLAELRETGTEADFALDDEAAEADGDAVDADDASGADVELAAQIDAADGDAAGDEVDDDEWDLGPDLPIAGYDERAVSEIIGALGALSAGELADVRGHEVATKNRRTVLAAIDRRLATTSTAGEAAPARKAAPAKKAAPARKAAPVKKAAPTETATPVQKAAPRKR